MARPSGSSPDRQRHYEYEPVSAPSDSAAIGGPSMRSSPIQAKQDPAAPVGTRTFRLPLDPLLTLSVVGLAIASIVTLGPAPQNVVAGQPDYYTHRQAVYLIVGGLFMLALSRFDYARLRPLKNGIYIALIVSILAVLGLGHSAQGAQRAIAF